jgi:succinate dehydrogenase/fumarate reductase flavoprotein subunit
LDVTMHDWLVFSDFSALAPGFHFAAGAIAVALVQGVIVAGRSFLAWWRASGRLEFPPDSPTRIWAELKELRAGCATSATNLEAVVARFGDAARAKVAERANGAARLQRLQRALDEKAAVIAGLEEKKAELALVQEQLLLQLHRQDEELRTRATELATAEQTIKLLNGLIGLPDRAKPPAPRRAAG